MSTVLRQPTVIRRTKLWRHAQLELDRTKHEGLTCFLDDGDAVLAIWWDEYESDQRDAKVITRRVITRIDEAARKALAAHLLGDATNDAARPQAPGTGAGE